MNQPTLLDKAEIRSRLLAIIDAMTSDWDMDFSGDLDESTMLVADLGFESIDFVMLIAEIEGAFQRQGLPYDRLLMNDGDYVSDLSIGEVVGFLESALAARDE